MNDEINKDLEIDKRIKVTNIINKCEYKNE